MSAPFAGSLLTRPSLRPDIIRLWDNWNLVDDVANGRIKLAFYNGGLIPETYAEVVTGGFPPSATYPSGHSYEMAPPIVAFSNPVWSYKQLWGDAEAPDTSGLLINQQPPPPTWTGWVLQSDPVSTVIPNDVNNFGGHVTVRMFRDTGDPATSIMLGEYNTDVLSATAGPITIDYPNNRAFMVSLSAYAPSLYGHDLNAEQLINGQLNWRTDTYKVVVCNELYGPRRRYFLPNPDTVPANIAGDYHYADDFGLSGAGWNRGHRWLSDIPAAAILGISEPVPTRFYRIGSEFGDNSRDPIELQAHATDVPIIATGTAWNAILFKHTGDPATSPLLYALAGSYQDGERHSTIVGPIVDIEPTADFRGVVPNYSPLGSVSVGGRMAVDFTDPITGLSFNWWGDGPLPDKHVAEDY